MLEQLSLARRSGVSFRQKSGAKTPFIVVRFWAHGMVKALCRICSREDTPTFGRGFGTKGMQMNRFILLPLIALNVIAAAAMPARSMPYSDMVVFGDSLSDNGNIFEATSSILPFGIGIPGSPYDKRLSDGPVYNEYLAQAMGFTIEPALTGGNNYAFASAATDYHSLSFFGLEELFGFPSVQDQIVAYAEPLYLQGISPDPKTLHIVWAGANNLLDTMDTVAELVGSDPNLAIEIAQNNTLNAVADIIEMSLVLEAIGVDEMMVINLPDLGRTPAAGGNSAIGSGLTDLFNAVIEYVTPLMTWIDVITFDANALFDSALDNPEAYGFTNVTDPCVTGGLGYIGFGSVCDNPDTYLFWDDLHPTTRAHQFLADEMLLFLETLGREELPSANEIAPLELSGGDFAADLPELSLLDLDIDSFVFSQQSVPEPPSLFLVGIMLTTIAFLWFKPPGSTQRFLSNVGASTIIMQTQVHRRGQQAVVCKVEAGFVRRSEPWMTRCGFVASSKARCQPARA